MNSHCPPPTTKDDKCAGILPKFARMPSQQEGARSGRPSPGALVLAVSWLALASCAAARPVVPDGRIQVAVSVPPQGYLVERIGGPRVRVEVMIPPGASHTTYSPSPRQMVALSEARLYVQVGHPAFLFETEHIDPFLAAHPGIHVVDMSRGMELILDAQGEGAPEPPRRREGTPEPPKYREGAPEPPGRREGATKAPGPHAELPGLFGPEEDHEHASGDPHVWVAPSTVRVAARNVARALSELDPAHAGEYRANLGALLRDVDALDRDIRRQLAGAPGRSFMVYHPAWGYFAREYGLTQVSIEAGGREPSAARLIELVELARREGVRAIFVQRGFARKSADVLAGEIGGRVVVVDPMGYDWLAEMRRAAREFREALAEAREEAPRNG
jgi:zinc transport system substrate-binding protein